MLYAYAEATVPKISVMTRKAYGGGLHRHEQQAPAGRHEPGMAICRDRSYGPRRGSKHSFPEELAKAENPEETRTNLTEDYRDRFSNPYVAASRGYLDDVIEPQETRPRLIKALDMLQNKRDTLPPKKHGNIPL